MSNAPAQSPPPPRAQPQAAAPRATPDEGLLDKVGTAQLLAEAWRARRTGQLRVAEGRRERSIVVVDGAPVAVEARGEPDGLAKALEGTGRIKAADRRRLEQLAAERECSHASAALALKLVEPTDLYPVIRAIARQQIAETFAWRTGAYRWSPLAGAPPANARPHDVLALIQRELPQRWGSERLLAAASELAARRADVSPRLRRIALKLGEAGPVAAKVIGRLDGQAPLGRILGEVAGEPLAAATLWTLWHAGILREGEGRANGADAALEFEVEVAADAPAENVEHAAAPAAASSADGAPDPVGLDAEAIAIREEIVELSARLGQLDYYAVLGLDAGAAAAAIKKAYFKAAKRYHPDSLARKGLGGLEEKAARVFGRVSEAFETLSDPDKKAAYDRGASHEPEIDTARLAQAETSFRKGEILLKMGNFQGALEYLQPAVELWPDEPAYQSALGWALYKQPASDAERARTHLELAHRQAPDDAVTLFRLGMVLRALGDEERSAPLIARARRLESSLGG